MNSQYLPFYSNEKIEQKLDLIHHMLQFGDELLLVSGEKGVGKSSQLQELMRRLGEGWQICYLNGNESPQISQLFEKISQSFDYDYSTVPSSELLNGFKSHLEQGESGKTYALLIDDAEQLDESTLEAITHLSQLKNGHDRLLRVALVGSDILRDTPALKTIPFREVVIEPLDDEQSRAYIEFCIEQGRYEFGKIPSTTLQQQVLKSAKGNPEEIEAMLQGSSVSTSLWIKLRDWRISVGILLLLAAGAGYLLQSENKRIETLPAKKSVPPPQFQQPVIRQSPVKSSESTPIVKTQEVDEAPKPADQRDNEALLIGELLQKSEANKIASIDSDGDNRAVDAAGTTAPPILEASEESQETVEGSNKMGESSQAEDASETPVSVVAEDAAKGRSWLQSQPETSFIIQLMAAEREAALDELIAKEKLQKGVARFSFVRAGRTIHVLTQGIYSERASAEEAFKRYSSAVKPWIRPVGDIHQLFIDSSPPALIKQQRETVLDIEIQEIKDSAWLWSQDPELITIQLVAGSNRQMLQPFVDGSLKVGVTAVLESKRESKPWYILLHGSYRTRDEARESIRKLPINIKSYNPWVRSFASVHDELSRTN